jgi:hypothetical protein
MAPDYSKTLSSVLKPGSSISSSRFFHPRSIAHRY